MATLQDLANQGASSPSMPSLSLPVQCFTFLIIPCLTVFTLEELVLNCSSTECWCGASVELVHSLPASCVCLLGVLVHDLSLHPMASNMPDGHARLANTLVHHIELVPCLRLGSNVLEEVARRESSNASSSPNRRASFGTLHITSQSLPAERRSRAPSHPLPKQPSATCPALSSAGPAPAQSQNVLRAESKQTGAAGTNTVAEATRTQLNHSFIHTAQAHERSVLRVPRTHWMTDSRV